MVDEPIPIALKMRLWGYDAVKIKLIELIGLLIDTNDESDNPQPIYSSVIGGHPQNVELYNGPLCKVILNGKNDADEVGERHAEMKGNIITYIPGDDEDAATLCTHYCDIVEAFLENNNILGIRGCTIKPNPNNTQNWIPVNVTPKENDPTMCVVGVTGFIVNKSKEAAIEMTIPVPEIEEDP